MRIIKVDSTPTTIYDVDDFPYDKFNNVQRVERGKKSYFSLANTFDIETTTMRVDECPIFHRDFGFMYIWQFCCDEITCIGRTWESYKTFINRLKSAIGVDSKTKLVVYVHNLQFEFQFMRNFFNVESVFARSKRDVVYAVIENVEYRCSYALSNMSLDKFLKNTKGVKLRKLSGEEFDYRKKRYPDTELTDKELEYSVVDVIGLCQAIKSKMEEDDLIDIPLTSTGYVRREFRDKCLSSDKYKKHMINIALTPKTYALCTEACRGGVSGSNSINTGWTIDNVDSFDIKSSYPYQMATKYFPQSKFLQVRAEFGTDKFDKLLNRKCCLIVWECSNLRLKKWEGIPYISKAKCRAISGGKFGNGKVYRADRIGMCCTEIDFMIIQDSYDFDNVIIHEMYFADRGMLAKPFREHLMEMFQYKTDLEGGDKYIYAKYKNKINAAFGMMLTDILNPEIEYIQGSNEPWVEEPIENIQKALNKYYYRNTSFLSYQHGVWVTAHARNSLYKGMKIVGNDIVQVDTDSVKTIGDYHKEFDALNKQIMKEAENFDIKPYSFKNGEKVYLGIWEHENGKHKYTYSQFKSLGAKKYVYKESGNDELEITVSGLRKGAAKWMENNGGFDAFSPGTVVPPIESGRTASVYNDLQNVHLVMVNGHEVIMGSNIAINDVSYTVGVTDEWREMVFGEPL